ncbi:stalk domain-containing protein [Paenibacillus sp. MAH-36]|uniref:Stalk domain-containing protein n=1 Tax=Paenibacillus violae TaxID=3077234 RepID=A0ABU3RA97_9BACL|nr:stalk domain-containing protein [Paenibacillus sp. PFR10]MDU0201016.1 stalk domain-containing protein [Paenibacillus sp. PFR10]
MQFKSSFFPVRLFSFLLAFCLIVSFVPNGRAFADSSSFQYKRFPELTVGISRPEIGFTFVTTTFKVENVSFQMLLDNQEVKGTWDQDANSYTYLPQVDLKPGEHHVDLFINMSGYHPMSESWTFIIAKKADTSVTASPTAEQQKGLNAVNDYRKLFGLQPLHWSQELSQAAQLHASYLHNNQVDAQKVSLHVEDNAKAGYIGETLTQRARYVNYTGLGMGEDASYGWSNITDAIDSLFDAPYHRIPFLMPEATEIGIDREGSYVVMDFGFKQQASTQMIVSPAPGDRYVPIDFNGHESPDPLQIHRGAASYPVGYPLLAVISGQNVTNIMLDEASLVDSEGKAISILHDTPNSDKELDNAVMLIPTKPLLPDSRYTAHVKVSFMDNGQAKTLDKDWSFQTEPAPSVGKQKLHEDSELYIKQLQMTGDVPHVVTFKLQESAFTLDGIKLTARMEPVIIDGSSYLWVRDLAGALGASVSWDESKQAAIYTKKGKTITFFTNKAAYADGNQERETQTPAKLYNGTTLIPVRLMSEVLGAKVKFDDTTKVITITY